MSIWRRSPASVPTGVYDEIVSEALEARLLQLEQTHAIDIAEVSKDSDVDEQLVTLVREQVHAELPLKGDEAAADGGDVDAEAGGGGGDLPVAHEGEEDAQVVPPTLPSDDGR